MMSCSQKNENPIYVFCLSLIMYFSDKKPATTTTKLLFFKCLHFGERKAVVKSVNGEICYFKNERTEFLL